MIVIYVILTIIGLASLTMALLVISEGHKKEAVVAFVCGALWIPSIVIYILASLIGLVVVLVTYPNVPKFFAAPEDRPSTRWEMAVRNKAYGLRWILPKPEAHDSFGPGKDEIEPTKQSDKFRWRVSLKAPFVSLRFVWRWSEKKYGELYWGWTLDALDKDGFRFTPQLRPKATVGQ